MHYIRELIHDILDALGKQSPLVTFRFYREMRRTKYTEGAR